jgi:hypothetical protein
MVLRPIYQVEIYLRPAPIGERGATPWLARSTRLLNLTNTAACAGSLQNSEACIEHVAGAAGSL